MNFPPVCASPPTCTVHSALGRKILLRCPKPISRSGNYQTAAGAPPQIQGPLALWGIFSHEYIQYVWMLKYEMLSFLCRIVSGRYMHCLWNLVYFACDEPIQWLCMKSDENTIPEQGRANILIIRFFFIMLNHLGFQIFHIIALLGCS